MMKANEFLNAPGISLDIALTPRCLLSCRYCTVAKIPTPELSANQWRDIIRSLAALCKIDLISLEGGEPLLREDLDQILEVALQHAGAVKIVTSGILPCRLPDALILNPRFHFEVSLDGPSPLHNFLRDGSYPAAWKFLRACLRQGSRVQFRTVISRHNLAFYERWLDGVDRACASNREKIGFFFDTIIAPQSFLKGNGLIPRAPMRAYPAEGLLPAPFEIWNLFRRLKRRPFGNLTFRQDEPLRGCKAGRIPFLSLDPAGIYSFCCESPRGFGSILEDSTEACLLLLDEIHQNLSCRTCAHFADAVCCGCWSGQKCGMVGHWGLANCRKLYDLMTPMSVSLARNEIRSRPEPVRTKP